MAKLVLVRHGQSQWNLENRFTGWIDVPLSVKGEEEAREAGLKLKGMRFDKAYTSVLKRAMDTLTLILEVTGQTDLEVEKDQALNERHYGDLQGLNKSETARKYGDQQVHLWRRSYDVAPPHGESLKDTAARTLPYFKRRILPDLEEGKNILVSAHGNSLRSIVMDLEKISDSDIPKLEIPTGVPWCYEVDSKGRVLKKEVLS